MSRKVYVFLIVFLGIMTAMAPLSTDMYLPSLPELSKDFGISTSMTQMTLTMTMIGMALGQVMGGPVSDRYGRKLPLLAGMVFFALSAFACSVVGDIYIFLGFRFLMGFSGAFGIVIARAIARDVCAGPALMQFLAILMLVNGLAPILAPVAGAQILRFFSWHTVFDVLTVIGIFQFMATLVFKETLPKEKRVGSLSEGFKAFGTLLGNKYFDGHCLLQCFTFGAFFSYIAGSAFLFQNIYHLSAQTYSFIFGGIGIGIAIMGSIPAKLANVVREAVMLKYSLMVPVLGAVLLLTGIILSLPAWYLIAAIFITVTPLSVMGAASMSLALSKCGQNAGGGSALLGFCNMFLGGILMPVVGIAGDTTALPMGIIILVCELLSLISFYFFIAPYHKKEMEEE